MRGEAIVALFFLCLTSCFASQERSQGSSYKFKRAPQEYDDVYDEYYSESEIPEIIDEHYSELEISEIDDDYYSESEINDEYYPESEINGTIAEGIEAAIEILMKDFRAEHATWWDTENKSRTAVLSEHVESGLKFKFISLEVAADAGFVSHVENSTLFGESLFYYNFVANQSLSNLIYPSVNPPEIVPSLDVPATVCMSFEVTGVAYLVKCRETEVKILVHKATSYIEIYDHEIYHGSHLYPETVIGRVYVQSHEDWFYYQLHNALLQGIFHVSSSGVITMNNIKNLPSEVGSDGGNNLRQGSGKGSRFGGMTIEIDVDIDGIIHLAVVYVEFKRVSREAMLKSGSMRIAGSAEDFISVGQNGTHSKMLRLKEAMLQEMNSFEVFALNSFVDEDLPWPDNGTVYTDVRFAGQKFNGFTNQTEYVPPETLERLLSSKLDDGLAAAIGIEPLMIHVDECADRAVCPDKYCFNMLSVNNTPVATLSDGVSLVGINAQVEPLCSCSRNPFPIQRSYDNDAPCETHPCPWSGCERMAGIRLWRNKVQSHPEPREELHCTKDYCQSLSQYRSKDDDPELLNDPTSVFYQLYEVICNCDRILESFPDVIETEAS